MEEIAVGILRTLVFEVQRGYSVFGSGTGECLVVFCRRSSACRWVICRLGSNEKWKSQRLGECW